MSFQYGERWAQGLILQWINQIIKEQKFPFQRADQEVQIKTAIGTVRYPDIVIWNDTGEKVVCLIELKTPVISAYDEELVDDALKKSTDAGIPFFVTWNINKLVLWETFRPGTTLLERRLLHEDVLDIKDLRELTKAEVEKAIKSFLAKFLQTLQAYYEEKITRPPEVYVLPKLPPDEILVHFLKTAVDSLYIPVSNNLIRMKGEDPEFYGKLVEWFVGQGWLFEDSEEDYDRVARQAVYLMINKILFYNILKEKFGLKDINVEDVFNGEELKKKLQEYFNFGININPRYGIIFAADFLERIPIPNEIVNGLKRLIVELNKYDFSKIGYDVVGKIFEKLIPKTERHKLGQYFTSTDIVDLILGFTIKHPDDRVLDPACGSGTFLVRAYHRKKFLAQKLFKEGKYVKPLKSHEELVRELWGIDIAKFPAHLALINIVRENIEAIENIPNIACKDFFEVLPGGKSPLYELAFPVTKIKNELEVEFPRDCHAVVTNPPYTRQEEMEDILLGGYKDRLRELIKKTCEIEVSKRSSIYAYFFLHGANFLAKNGRLGLITSNSWLDVDFGKHLQEFFLKNFKIITVIESKVERWFEDADINTAITILEKCDNEKARDSNLVKFVYLKRKLREILPVGETEEERWNYVEKFVSFVENCDKDEKLKSKMREIEFLGKKLWIYEDETFRITMISQADLWAEGWNEEENRYEGSKWGKYIRAPDIFFKILEKGKDLFIPLGKIATVRFGIKTGANEFFYLTEKEIEKWSIEREFWMHPVKCDEWLKIKDFIPKEDIWIDKNGEYFKQSQYAKEYKLDDVLIDGNVIWIPNYVIKSPKECKSIVVDPKNLKYRVLMIHKDKAELKETNVLKYIEWGEEQGFHDRPTCKSRQRWYELSEVRGELLCMMSLNDRHIFWLNNVNSFVDARLYGILLKECYSNKESILSAILNSSFVSMFVELWGRVNLGQGALDVKVYEYEKMPIINPAIITETQIAKISTVLNTISKRKIGSVFKEIGAKDPKEVSLNRIDSDRNALDTIIMQEILGLTEEERLEVYKAVIDLVKTRLERAKTVTKKKEKKGVDIEALANSIINRLTTKVKKFPEAYLRDYKGLWSDEIEIPEGKPIIGSDIGGFYVQVRGKEVYRSWNQDEIKFVYFAALTETSRVKLPLDEQVMKIAVETFEKDYNKLKEEVNGLLLTLIPDVKIRKRVEDEIWKMVFHSNARHA